MIKNGIKKLKKNAWGQWAGKFITLSVMITGIGAGIVLFGCQVPVSTHSDSNSNTRSTVNNSFIVAYDELKSGSFRGGSLIYNPDNESFNHLIIGMEIPIRLSKLEAVFDNNSQKMELRDNKALLKYGMLVINSISQKEIRFQYAFCSTAGIPDQWTTVTLNGEKSIDIDKDGIFDIAYIHPPDERKGFSNAMYLSFLCSEETKTTTMYKLSPEYYKNNWYPSGIIGVNLFGNFLILSNDFISQNTGINTISSYTYLAPVDASVFKKGDYLINGSSGNFEKITEITLTRAGEASISSSSEDVTVSEALNVMHLDLQGDIEEIITEYGDEANRAYYEIFSYNYTHNFLDDKPDAGHCQFTNNFSFGVDVDASISVNWFSIDGYAKTDLVLKDKASLDIELNYSYEKKLKKKIFEPKKTFLVYGIPVEVKMPIYLGVDFNANAKGSFKTSVGLEVKAGAGVNYSVGLIPPHFNVTPYPIFSHSVTFEKPVYSLSGDLTLTPYLEINPAISIAYIITPECINRVYITGYAGFVYSSSEKYTEAYLKYGIKSDAYIDIIGLWRPHLGTLIDYSENIFYSKIKVSTPVPPPVTPAPTTNQVFSISYIRYLSSFNTGQGGSYTTTYTVNGKVGEVISISSAPVFTVYHPYGCAVYNFAGWQPEPNDSSVEFANINSASTAVKLKKGCNVKLTPNYQYDAEKSYP